MPGEPGFLLLTSINSVAPSLGRSENGLEALFTQVTKSLDTGNHIPDPVESVGYRNVLGSDFADSRDWSLILPVTLPCLGFMYVRSCDWKNPRRSKRRNALI